MPPRGQHPTVSGHHPTTEFLHKERAFFIHGPPSSKLKEVFPKRFSAHTPHLILTTRFPLRIKFFQKRRITFVLVNHGFANTFNKLRIPTKSRPKVLSFTNSLIKFFLQFLFLLLLIHKACKLIHLFAFQGWTCPYLAV
jgi:hypothetical protein